MTDLSRFHGRYIPVKYFLSSYRALSDGRSGIQHLEERLKKANFLLSEWRVIWIGSCAVLRTAIELFNKDSKSFLDESIRNEIKIEWIRIKENKQIHSIYWDFLWRERNNIVHEYDWQAYETWLKPDGSQRPARLSLLTINDDGARPVLVMRGGPFKGRDSLELLKEGADWVQDRIFDAIKRAGVDPEEERGLLSFQPRPKPSRSIKDSLMGKDEEPA